MDDILTKEQIIQKLNSIQGDFDMRISFSPSFKGIDIEWTRLPKYKGGNYRRKTGAWGIWKYYDIISDKWLTKEQAIAEILKPISERQASADLTNIIYCKRCGNIGVGKDEQLAWGRLKYVASFKTYPNGWKIANHEYADICPQCCRKILKSS